jgi:hypothetical protein
LEEIIYSKDIKCAFAEIKNIAGSGFDRIDKSKKNLEYDYHKCLGFISYLHTRIARYYLSVKYRKIKIEKPNENKNNYNS